MSIFKLLLTATLLVTDPIYIPTITINSASEALSPQITIRSIYDFESNLSLKVKTDSRLDVDDVLIQYIERFNMVDMNGVRITNGFDIDKINNIVIGFSGGTSEIINSKTTTQGVQVTGSFKDKNGAFVSPPIDQLAAYNLQGDKLCFDYDTAQIAAQPIYFALLLDRSGSMTDHIGDVKQTANDFLKLLPAHAMCAVANFGGDWSYSHTNYQSCGDTDFGINDIEVSGGTDIYPLLHSTYTNYAQPGFNGHQKATIIVTDGYTLADEAVRQELIALKNDVLTLTYFIGGTQRDELEGITDSFITHDGNVSKSLGQYFRTLGTAYTSQKTLQVKPCGAS